MHSSLFTASISPGAQIEARTSSTYFAAADFAHVFHLFYRPLVRYSRMITKDDAASEEIASETLVTLWQNRETVTGRALPAYLFRVCRNACFNRLRDQRRMLKRMTAYLQLVDPRHGLHEEPAVCCVSSEEQLAALRQAIGGLPLQCRRIMLRVIGGEAYADIAREFGLSASTVRNQRSRAVRLLKMNLRRLIE